MEEEVEILPDEWLYSKMTNAMEELYAKRADVTGESLEQVWRMSETERRQLIMALGLETQGGLWHLIQTAMTS